MSTNDNIQKLMKFLPEDLIKKQVGEEWKAKTKCLNKLPEQKHKVKGLMTNATKTEKYKNKTVDKYLHELNTQETTPTQIQQDFIKWFQTEYVKRSFEKITGKPFLEPKKQQKKKRILGIF